MTPEQEQRLFETIGSFGAKIDTVEKTQHDQWVVIDGLRDEVRKSRESFEAYASQTVRQLGTVQRPNGNGSETDKQALVIGRWFQSIPLVAQMVRRNLTAVVTVGVAVVVLWHEWRQIQRESADDFRRARSTASAPLVPDHQHSRAGQ